MKKIIRNDFESQARKLGHSIRKLNAGEVVKSTVKVKDIRELRKLFFDGIPKKDREKRAKSILKQFPSIKKNGSGSGILHRVEAYVYGDKELSKADLKRIESLFPLSVETMSVEDKTLGQGEVWTLGDSDDPQFVNVKTLTMDAGSYMQVINTQLTLTIENLVNNAGKTVGYQLAVLGKKGGTGGKGDTGDKGPDGGQGPGGNCTSAGIAGRPGGTGIKGGPGGKGKPGKPGDNGLPSLATSLTINGTISGSTDEFIILSQSGAGGDGGKGGTGGTGGTGGKGGDGATCGCTGSAGGNGGKGGKAGKGGIGGQGGDGTDGSNIYVNVQKSMNGKIGTPVYKSAAPGDGGDAGDAGAQGDGGSGGGGGKHNSGGSGGGKGDVGSDGEKGPKGTKAGNAGQVQVSNLP